MKQQFQENAVVCFLWRGSVEWQHPTSQSPSYRGSVEWQHPNSQSPSYRENVSRFKIAGVTPNAIFTTFGTQRFSPFLAPKRRSTWTSLQIRDGARLSGTATTRFPVTRNLCLCVKLEETRRTCWELHWRFMELHCIYFCYKSFHIMLPVFIWLTLLLRRMLHILFTYSCTQPADGLT